MAEVRLWRWRYVDEFGKRRVTSYRLTEKSARKAAQSGKGRSLARDTDAARLDELLSALAEEALAGRHVERPWEILRAQCLPGWEQEDAASALALGRSGLLIDFTVRTAAIGKMSYEVCPYARTGEAGGCSGTSPGCRAPDRPFGTSLVTGFPRSGGGR